MSFQSDQRGPVVIDETSWIVQAQHGDDEAFMNLVETYQKPVYNLCYRMLGVPESAEDASQETFLKVYQNLARYDRERSFATWLLSIAAHHCIDRLRRKRFIPVSIDEHEEGQIDLPDHSSLDPEGETAKKEEHEELHACLQSLDPVDRAAIIMRYWQDCSEVEIAQALHLTIPAVKSRLHRARRQLASLWEGKQARVRTERKPYGSPAF
jgi:RNA polymerase sigma-70 factor (ECF subfamily)